MNARLSTMIGVSALLLASQAAAGPVQVLLQEDFQDVTGVTSNASVRTVDDILTNNPAQLPAGTSLPSIANTGNSAGTTASFNVRRSDNQIDGTSGSSSPDNFDNFFPGTTNLFLVVGDESGNLSGTANGGSTAGSSATMSIRFPLAPITLSDPLGLAISFDYVFDANNVANADDFFAELILADNSVVNLLGFSAPSASTRGTFGGFVPSALFASSAPAALNFRLLAAAGGGSSAVGLDNLSVNAIPEPGVLSLLGLGFFGLLLTRGRPA